MVGTLGQVHAAGVFHRDLKPANIIIRGASERPLLIDFGVGAVAGAACPTGAGLPPGTEEFRAPEQLRFEREHAQAPARYDYGPADELWALGVTFYWLLTDVFPFGERTDPGGAQGLRERILTHRPLAPHQANARVPQAVSALCVKMLADPPPERFAGVGELCAALREALTTAEGDAAWDAPLMDPDDPQLTTTADDPERREPEERLRLARRWMKRRARRGRAPPAPGPLLPPAPAPAQPPVAARAASIERLLAEVYEDGPPTGEAGPEAPAPRRAASPGASGRSALPVPAPPAPGAHEAARRRSAPWRLGLAVAGAAAAVGLAVSAGPWGPGASSPPPARTSPALPPGVSGEGVGRHEVAPAPKPLDAPPGEGAAPAGAPLPAPDAHAMPAQTKKNETQTPRAGGRAAVKPTVAAAALTACSLLDGGCTHATPQVLPGPPAITCPEGWKDTHAKFEIRSGEVVVHGYEGRIGLSWETHKPAELAPVKDGPATVDVEKEVGSERSGPVTRSSVPGLPGGTLLTGTWKLGEHRIFGTFTQAQIPGEETLPVCLVVYLDHDLDLPDEDGNVDGFLCRPGLGSCPWRESKPGNIMSYTRLYVYPADSRVIQVP